VGRRRRAQRRDRHAAAAQTFPLYEDFFPATEQALGDEVFRLESAAGRHLGFDQIVELALRA
jgi:hypothetical protein